MDVDVALDETTDSMNVKYSYNGKLYHSYLYHLLSFEKVPDTEAAAMFSWRSYAIGKSNVLSFLITNGVTTSAEIRHGKLISVRDVYRLSPAIGTIDPWVRKGVYLAMVAFTVAGIVLVIRGGSDKEQTAANNRKEKT